MHELESENGIKLQTYVNNKYFVSTLQRRCSAAAAPELWYYETLAWELDKLDRKRDELVKQVDSGLTPQGATESHFKVCKDLMEADDGK